VWICRAENQVGEVILVRGEMRDAASVSASVAPNYYVEIKPLFGWHNLCPAVLCASRFIAWF
jgi:hypothetical protein